MVGWLWQARLSTRLQVTAGGCIAQWLFEGRHAPMQCSPG
jgi:hypothetical protein